MPARSYRFGAFTLDTARRTLLRDGAPVPLGGRAFDVLAFLIRHRDRVVDKEELLEQVWRRGAVEANNLTVTVSALRKALGETREERLVQTVAGRGYQFVAPVTEHSAEQDTGEAGTALSTAPPAPASLPPEARKPSSAVPPLPAGLPSIAVLPFANMSCDPDEEYFGDGLAEDVITELSRNRWLTVIARGSSFQFRGAEVDSREVARRFGVRYVLGGSVRRAGARVRVAAQLTDALSGAQVAAVRYDRELADLFAAQDDVTATILTAIRPAIYEAEQSRSLRRPPDSVDAWAAYQRGMWHASRFERIQYWEARTWFRRAIELDPHYAPGYYGLGLMMLHDGSNWMPDAEPDWQEQGERLARQAVGLDRQDSSAHHVLGLALMLRGEHAGALDSLDAALALNPSDAAAHHTRGATLVFTERPMLGLAAVEQSIRLSPQDPRVRVRWLHKILGHFFLDELAEAEEVARMVVGRWPDTAAAYRLLAIVLGEAGRQEEARQAIARAMELQPGPFDDYSHARMPWYGKAAYRKVVAALRRVGWSGPADD